jgi:hypothetical protein
VAAQASGVAVGDDLAGADVDANEEEILTAAVLSAEGALVVGNASSLADKIRAERLLPRALDDEHIGAQDPAGSDLPVGVGPGASSVDDDALVKRLVTRSRQPVERKQLTSLVKVRHSLLGTPPISLKTRVLGPRTGD